MPKGENGGDGNFFGKRIPGFYGESGLERAARLLASEDIDEGSQMPMPAMPWDHYVDDAPFNGPPKMIPAVEPMPTKFFGIPD